MSGGTSGSMAELGCWTTLLTLLSRPQSYNLLTLVLQRAKVGGMMQIPRLSPIQFHILELLIAKDELYGLEMVKASDRLKRGTVYVTLSRMEAKGFVESWLDRQPDQSGMPRRRYRVTGHGARVLSALQIAQAHVNELASV